MRVLLCLVLLSACDETCKDAPEGTVDLTIKQSALQGNDTAIDRFSVERAVDSHSHWLALVPGTSEQWGHHKAPPEGVLVSDEFAARLDRSKRLLDSGAVRFVLVSGGSVDLERPDYNEADRGREYLLQRGVAPERLFVDRLAEHSTTNVRNADKLAAQLGLDRIVIVTTMPERGTLQPSDIATQGYYFLYHSVSTFDSRSKSELGYTLGNFSRIMLQGEPAILHCGFNARIHADDYGP